MMGEELIEEERYDDMEDKKIFEGEKDDR